MLRPRSLLTGVVLIYLTACAGPAMGGSALPAPSSSLPDPAPPTVESGSCPDGATVTVGAQDSASGLRAVTLVLTVCGGKPYTVDGYGEVALLGEDQQPLDVAVQTSGDSPLDGSGRPLDPGPSSFTLAPGTTAFAVLVWRNRVTAGEAVTARQISVVPGPGRTPQVVELLVDPGDTGQVRLTAWQPGLPG